MSDIKRLKLCIDNEWIESKSAKYMPVMNPSLGVQIAETPCATQAEVDAAVAAALSLYAVHECAEDTPPYAEVTPSRDVNIWTGY
jgi:acyl-CoA reductase-like NAD-dependent aldehyde dehydrogenase